MFTFNQVVLLGNVGKDPEMVKLPSGDLIATLSLATSHDYKDKDTEEWHSVTEWHKLKAFGKKAEQCSKYVRNGDKIQVVGELRYEKWEEADGRKRSAPYIRVQELLLPTGGKKDKLADLPIKDIGNNEQPQEDPLAQ